MQPLQQGPSRQGRQTELQQQAALQRQAAHRQPAGSSGQPLYACLCFQAARIDPAALGNSPHRP
jgi:hypothetical protein